MPRLRTKVKRYRYYDATHITQLCTGHCFFHGSGFGNELFGQCDQRAMREAWDKLKPTILPQFIALNPCRRPFAWWKYDSPKDEPLRRYTGTSPFDQDDAPEHTQVVWFGKCPVLWQESFDDPPVWETQAEYLQRHDLLTAAERTWLEAHSDQYDDDELNVNIEPIKQAFHKPH